MTRTPPDRPGRGRRPAAEVRRGILAVTADILLTDGVAGVTFDKIAAAAPASKATLYKWWPSPGALAAEAYFTHVEEQLQFDDTGNIEHDLRTQLHAHVALLNRPDVGPVIAKLIGAAQSDTELAEAWSRNYSTIRRRTAVERLQRAKEQGQIHPDVDVQVVVDQLWGACYHRLLIPDEPLSIEFADSLINNMSRGILVQA